MIKYLREYRFQITLFLFVLIPIIAIDTSTREPRSFRFYDRLVVSITSPIQSSLQWLLDQSVSLFQNYVYLWDTRKENLLLIQTNRQLLSEIGQLRETKQENVRLRTLLDFREKMKFETITARVIAKDASTDFRSIRLNRGESAGVKKDMSVVTSEGIVGRVLRTTDQTADVVTVVDTLSAIDATVERSRARGIVEGMTEDLCQLRYALRTDDIIPGDLLLSSGLGESFRKGFLLELF